jgi:hypothetical protein
MPLVSGPNTPAAPAAAQAASTPITPPANGDITPPPATEVVTISAEQLRAYTAGQERLASLEADQRARDATAQAEQVRLMAQRGEIEQAMTLQRQQSEEALNTERKTRMTIEERAKRYAVDGELSRVLASQPLVPGGAEQLTQLWRGQLLVEPHGDSYNVRTSGFQSVGDFVAAQLAQPHYAHFIRSNNQGGTGAANASHTAPALVTTPTAPAAPKTLGDAVILHMQSLNAKGTAEDPRVDMSQAMGLRRPVAR